jgi:Zn-dependent M16 (insulinase) family peptidase
LFKSTLLPIFCRILTPRLCRWFIDNPHVVILGKPSAKLAKTLEQNELARIEGQKAKLGELGLQEKKRKLEEAQEENDKPIPQKVIKKFKVPNIENIKFIETVNAVYVRASDRKPRHRNEIERILDRDVSDHSLDLVFSHTSTQFVTVSLFITTQDLPADLLPYLSLYLESFFTLPVMRNGQLVKYEEVVKEVNLLTVDKSVSLEVDNVTSEVLKITLNAEKSRYQDIVRLLGDLFVHSVFDPERYISRSCRGEC